MGGWEEFLLFTNNPTQQPAIWIPCTGFPACHEMPSSEVYAVHTLSWRASLSRIGFSNQFATGLVLLLKIAVPPSPL